MDCPAAVNAALPVKRRSASAAAADGSAQAAMARIQFQHIPLSHFSSRCAVDEYRQRSRPGR
jgi:hypothetical protein